MATRRRRPVQPDDFLRFHMVSDPQVSPDGRQLLFVKKHIGDKNNYVTNLWLVETAGGTARQFTSGDKDGSPRWSPDGTQIAFLSSREEQTQVFVIPAAGGEARQLTHFPDGRLSSPKWSPDGRSLAVTFRETEPEWTKAAKKQREETGGSTPPRVIDQMFYRLDGDGYFNSQRYALNVVDSSSGTHRKVFDKDQGLGFAWDWSADSQSLIAIANTNAEPALKLWDDHLFQIDAKKGRVKKLTDIPVGIKDTVACSPDGRWIAWAGRAGKENWGARNQQLYLYSLETGEIRSITESSDYCLGAVTLSDIAEASFDVKLLWAADSRRVYLNFGWHGGTHVFSVDLEGKEIQQHTSGAQTVSLGNVSSDGKTFAITRSDPVTLAEAGVLRKQKAAEVELEPMLLTTFNTALFAELDIQKPKSVTLQTGQGTPLQVWMIQPPGASRSTKYPAVLEIHGGPHTQYGETYFHEFQVLAAAGYVVVYSNPRGSKGYGEQHCVAIKGSWGGADWEDVQAVKEWMKQQTQVDTARLAIMGGSYGGYMTNWAIGHTTEFAAAITDRCVSNLVSMAGNSDYPLVPGNYWVNNVWDDPSDIWAQSPVKYFDRVQTPTLIIHSEGDLRCNVEQAEQVFVALKMRKIPTRLVRYPASTSHGMSRNGPPDLRMHRLGQILRWYEEHLR